MANREDSQRQLYASATKASLARVVFEKMTAELALADCAGSLLAVLMGRILQGKDFALDAAKRREVHFGRLLQQVFSPKHRVWEFVVFSDQWPERRPPVDKRERLLKLKERLTKLMARNPVMAGDLLKSRKMTWQTFLEDAEDLDVDVTDLKASATEWDKTLTKHFAR